jgi:opacity protein-like surface antigen
MGLKTTALIGAFIFLMPSAGALAADMPQPPPYSPPPVEIGSGWYLRGDIGYKIYSDPSAHWDEPLYGNMIDESLANTGLAGIGFGYKWNNYFRTDLTFDYEWPAGFHGRLPCPGACGTPPTAGRYSDEYADISAWTGLINGYIDLGNYSGFTPYIGAGIGASYLTATNVHSLDPDGTTPTYDSGSAWNLSWALMAGASYDFGNNWLLDVNYRYANLGNAVSGIIPLLDGTQPVKYDNITAQEIRIGLRYMIN